MNCQEFVSPEFVEKALTVFGVVSLLILAKIYHSGYWSLEQRKSRFNRDHFTTWK